MPIGTHGLDEREENDFYATDPAALDMLAAKFNLPDFIWECACGEGHLSKRMEEMGRNVVSTDLIDRGYGIGGIDFIHGSTPKYRSSDKVIRETVYKMRYMRLDGHSVGILTNPPFKDSIEFVLKGLERVPDGGYVIMLMRTLWLEGQERYRRVFKGTRPLYVFQLSNRIYCAKDGKFSSGVKSAMAYAWFVWRKGYYGNTILDWI